MQTPSPFSDGCLRTRTISPAKPGAVANLTVFGGPALIEIHLCQTNVVPVALQKPQRRVFLGKRRQRGSGDPSSTVNGEAQVDMDLPDGLWVPESAGGLSNGPIKLGSGVKGELNAGDGRRGLNYPAGGLI